MFSVRDHRQHDRPLEVVEARDQLYQGEDLTIGKIQAREQFLKRLVSEHEDSLDAVQDAEQGLSQAKEKVRLANTALVKTKQDEEALLKHREKWEKEQKIVQRRREEDEALHADAAQSFVPFPISRGASTALPHPAWF